MIEHCASGRPRHVLRPPFNRIEPVEELALSRIGAGITREHDELFCSAIEESLVQSR